MTSINQQYTPETDPNLNLRSDLWNTMTFAQLSTQQNLVIDKVAKLHMIMGASSTPSMQHIHDALLVALRELNQLIDSHVGNK